MRAFEFQACLERDDTLKVPRDVAAELEPERPLRVILLLPDSDEDRAWSQLTTEQFLAGYVDSDAVYDELPAG